MNISEPLLSQKTGDEVSLKKPVSSTFRQIARYTLVKGATILMTIFIGVFITMVFANRGGQVDSIVRNEITFEKDTLFLGWRYHYDEMSQEERARIDQWQLDREAASGLNLPYWPRQLILTIKALRLDWRNPVRITAAPGSYYQSSTIADIIRTDFPHTLLLVGPAFFILFLAGIPLALYLYRERGGWQDRLVTGLAAITSIPSWVFGILFVLLFTGVLHFLPAGGMYDTIPANSEWERILIVTKHMILPVLAILLSMFFQYIYTWRTFFLLYADEDYVELARAKGLPNKRVERSYILRPAMPYILTNFAILLVTFWQMNIALEKIFNWPGIGRLYILSLPNFLGEKFYPGIMPMTLGIVVLFAYLLGFTVFILDIVYAILDPRIRIGQEGETLRLIPARQRRFRFSFREKRTPAIKFAREEAHIDPSFRPQRERFTLETVSRNLGRTLKTIQGILQKIARYPSAVFGLVVILILCIGSIGAVILYPYNKLADAWYQKTLMGKVNAPRIALPAWVNFFRKEKLPPMIFLNSQNGTASKTVQTTSNESNKITLTYTIQYPYGDFPQGIQLYFHPKYTAKYPFAFIHWITPDGREYEIGRIGTERAENYALMDGNFIYQILTKNPAYKNWYAETGNDPTPAVDLLFADPSLDQPVVLPGTYTLRIDGLTFEPGSDLDAEMVLIGQVYGLAGTDYDRRDLLLPLLWGMPFALVFGLLGAFVTTVLSMLLAATGVWFGGWVDNIVQRLVEANMILPVIGIAVLIYAYLNVGIWTLLGIVVLLNVFSSPIKSFRAALLQVKDALYIEGARAYGASDSRIIFRYLIPRMIPILIPQLVILIPSYVFLEATLGIFNVRSIYPTWGRVIYDALTHGGRFGSDFWVLEPISLLLLTGLAFSMLGFALERILNPKIV